MLCATRIQEAVWTASQVFVQMPSSVHRDDGICRALSCFLSLLCAHTQDRIGDGMNAMTSFTPYSALLDGIGGGGDSRSAFRAMLLDSGWGSVLHKHRNDRTKMTVLLLFLLLLLLIIIITSPRTVLEARDAPTSPLLCTTWQHEGDKQWSSKNLNFTSSPTSVQPEDRCRTAEGCVMREGFCGFVVEHLVSGNRAKCFASPLKQRRLQFDDAGIVFFNWADAVDPRVCHDTVTPTSTVPPPSNLVRRHGTVATPTLELEKPAIPEGNTRSAAATPVPPTPLAPPYSTGSLSSTSISTSASPALPLSTYSEIWRVIAAILDPECGLTFITGTPLLPKHTFCAYDLTSWLSRNLVDVSSTGAAVKYAQSLLNGGYICHASGNRAHKFLNGFFLYTILAEATSSSSTQETSDLLSGRKSAGDAEAVKSSDIRKISFPTNYLPPSSTSPLGSFSTDFQKEWVEVLVVQEAPAATHPVTSRPRLTSTFYSSPPSQDEQDSQLVNGLLSTAGLGRVFGVENTSGIHVGSEGVLRKRVTRDLRDTSITTATAAALKRHPEWYCLLYDLNYHPTCAFALEIQWLVASASRLNEMVCRCSLLHWFLL
ncbi:unnamed protein product [Hydatigera taeniaeformis]|uniref:DEP domain-containing protein n=1 Tax=Hydatigena taeniaeformis TaxID=6205 RepID=A0A0R3WMW4_HYDTA|nr:unnamed protein product [Hydatigera taeniaeformis]